MFRGRYRHLNSEYEILTRTQVNIFLITLMWFSLNIFGQLFKYVMKCVSEVTRVNQLLFVLGKESLVFNFESDIKLTTF